jgi:hypothetical protein
MGTITSEYRQYLSQGSVSNRKSRNLSTPRRTSLRLRRLASSSYGSEEDLYEMHSSLGAKTPDDSKNLAETQYTPITKALESLRFALSDWKKNDKNDDEQTDSWKIGEDNIDISDESNMNTDTPLKTKNRRRSTRKMATDLSENTSDYLHETTTSGGASSADEGVIRESFGRGVSCTICYKKFRKGDVLTKLPCDHLFHG